MGTIYTIFGTTARIADQAILHSSFANLIRHTKFFAYTCFYITVFNQLDPGQ